MNKEQLEEALHLCGRNFSKTEGVVDFFINLMKLSHENENVWQLAKKVTDDLLNTRNSIINLEDAIRESIIKTYAYDEKAVKQ